METAPQDPSKSGFNTNAYGGYSDPSAPNYGAPQPGAYQGGYANPPPVPPPGYDQSQYGAQYGVGAPPAYDYKHPDSAVGGYPPAGHMTNAGYNQHAAVMVQPGMIVQPTQPYVDVPDHMCLSIVSLFFCLFIGIFSIINASNARNLKAAGQYQTALMKANQARSLAIWAIAVGLILTAINVTVRIILVGY